jgi:hypothetical protein
MLFTASNSTACWFDWWSGAEESWRVLCRCCVVWRHAGSIRETLFVGHERLCIVVYCSVINASFCFLQCMICSHHASSSSPLFICAESIIGCIFSPLDLFNTFLPFLIFAHRDLYDICFVYDEMEICRYWLNGWISFCSRCASGLSYEKD